jgi:hypothetical protein
LGDPLQVIAKHIDFGAPLKTPDFRATEVRN